MGIQWDAKPCFRFCFVGCCDDKKGENKALEVAKAFGAAVIKPKGDFALRA